MKPPRHYKIASAIIASYLALIISLVHVPAISIILLFASLSLPIILALYIGYFQKTVSTASLMILGLITVNQCFSVGVLDWLFVPPLAILFVAMLYRKLERNSFIIASSLFCALVAALIFFNQRPNTITTPILDKNVSFNLLYLDISRSQEGGIKPNTQPFTEDLSNNWAICKVTDVRMRQDYEVLPKIVTTLKLNCGDHGKLFITEEDFERGTSLGYIRSSDIIRLPVHYDIVAYIIAAIIAPAHIM